MSLRTVEAHTLTRENFLEVARRAGADECWGLESPSPRLFWWAKLPKVALEASAFLGDTVVIIHSDPEG